MSNLLLTLTRINLWHFVWVAIVLSLFLSVLASNLIHQQIVWEYLVAASFIALTVAGTLIYPIKIKFEREQLQDMTERKQLQRKIRESDAQLQAILDNSPNLIFLKDSDGRYLLVNRQFERMCHLTVKDIVGKSDEEIFSPEQSAVFQTNDKKVFQTAVPLEFEETAQHDDGPHTSIVFKFPLCAADGRPYALGGIATDITGRKQAEEAVRTSEARYRQLIELSQDAIFVLDDQGTFMMANPAGCKLFGYTEQEFVGMSVVNTYPAEERPAASERLRQLKIGTLSRFERMAMRKDGTTMPIEVSVSPITHKRYQAVVRDITERNRTRDELVALVKELQNSEQHLRQALEDRERLSQDLHDHVLQSLYAIGITLESCPNLIVKDSELAARRLESSIADLNGVMKEVRNYIEWPSTIITNPDQLRDALEELVRMIPSASTLTIHLQIDPCTAAQLTADESMHILQIAREAVSNSLRHARAKTGQVSLSRGDAGIRFEVQDDGIGFDVDAQEREGWGLRNIAARAARLGAEFKIISSMHGGGTRIILNLPR